jgi:hypothetical protein
MRHLPLAAGLGKSARKIDAWSRVLDMAASLWFAPPCLSGIEPRHRPRAQAEVNQRVRWIPYVKMAVNLSQGIKIWPQFWNSFDEVSRRDI